MGHKISSKIEIISEGCTMKHKRKRVRENPNSDKGKPHDHHYKSEASTDKNRFFHKVKGNNNGVTQNVNVEVKVEQQDDCLTSCFAGLAKCFGRN